MNAEHLLAHYERIADAPDAVVRLRSFILDLAVRGKVVPQNSKDEPASTLLERIAKEKAKRGSKDQVLPVVSQDDFPIKTPKGWALTRLMTISRRIHYGYTASADAALKDVRMLRITDIQDNNVNWPTVPGCIIDDHTVAQYELERGDILIARTGGTIGKTFLMRDVPVRAVFASYLIRVQGTNQIFDEYLKLFLESPLYWTQLRDGTRGTGQPNVNGQTLGMLVVPLPPLAEQHRIVAKVDELMALCDRLEAARAEREATRDRLAASTLARLNTPDPATFQADARFALNTIPALTTRPDQIKQLRQTILNLAVRGKLVQQGPNDEPAAALLKRIHKWSSEAIQKKQIRAPRKPLKPIADAEAPYMQPAGWVWARLGEIIYIQSGDGLTAANMEQGDVPVFGGNGVNGYHNKSNVNERTVVIGRVGYYCGSIHVTPPQAWVTDNAFITHFSSNSVFLDFLVLLLNATNLKEDENATAQPVISGSKIYPIIVGLPPLAEQHRIVAKVDALMKICDQLEANLDDTATTRRNLLDALLAETLAPTRVREMEAAE